MPYAPVTLGYVKSITAVDDYTLEIVLNRRSTPFLRNMALCISASKFHLKPLRNTATMYLSILLVHVHSNSLPGIAVSS